MLCLVSSQIPIIPGCGARHLRRAFHNYQADYRRNEMNKDRVKGKVKDIAGRVERQAGEWTDDPKKQAEGAAKQVEGKLQNAWGKAKDAAKDATKSRENADTTAKRPPASQPVDREDEDKEEIKSSGR
jgi:uncharacterized protein YjbJ (UPF0337 family)